MKLDLLSRKQVRSQDRVRPFAHIAIEDLIKISGGLQCSWFDNEHVMHTCGNYAN